ncbi:sulfatase [Planctomycetes bacterium K23_9]
MLNFRNTLSTLGPRVLISLALVSLTLVSGTTTVDAAQPNIVFILVDDLGYMDIGANNPDTFYETPHIDRLAASGMRFTNGYAANPVCSPTRYSIMTGRWPSRVKATNFFAGRRPGKFLPGKLVDRMALEEITLAEALKTKDYRTFFAGKWHLGPTEEFWPTKQGFDVNKAGHNAGGPYKGGKYFSPYGNPRLGDGPKGEHLTARLADETVNFIRESKDQPFMAYLAFYSVHTPLMAPKKLVQKYRDKLTKMDLSDEGTFADEEQVWQNSKKPRRVRVVQSHAIYAAMVESVDNAVGKVINALEEQGIADNTIVCLTSDNGGLSTSEGSPTSNLPLRGGKGWIYEGGIREAFLIRAPGVTQASTTCEVPVMSIDFFPTLLELSNIKHDAVDGKSLVPLLKQESKWEREELYWHYPHYSNQGGFPGAAIRQGDWKLIERFEDGRTQLYNLASDIGESVDLAQKDPERVDELKSKLHAWYKEVDAEFLQAKPDGPSPWRAE